MEAVMSRLKVLALQSITRFATVTDIRDPIAVLKIGDTMYDN